LSGVDAAPEKIPGPPSFRRYRDVAIGIVVRIVRRVAVRIASLQIASRQLARPARAEPAGFD
jgi:hypothetical protein